MNQAHAGQSSQIPRTDQEAPAHHLNGVLRLIDIGKVLPACNIADGMGLGRVYPFSQVAGDLSNSIDSLEGTGECALHRQSLQTGQLLQILLHADLM